MKIKCCWMYHDIMDLYGDAGNIAVLKKRCEDRSITFELTRMNMGEPCDFNEFDLVIMGGGADNEQNIIYEDLLARKESIQNAYNNNTFFFVVCGGFQLFGKYYKDSLGNMITGLGIADYYTESIPNQRCVGNIVVDAKFDDLTTKMIGFENHGGQTFDVSSAIGNVLYGHGNTFNGKQEGYYDGKILATYVHGPLLPNNPEVADFIIYKSLLKKEQIQSRAQLTKLDDSLEEKSREVLLERYLKA